MRLAPALALLLAAAHANAGSVHFLDNHNDDPDWLHQHVDGQDHEQGHKHGHGHEAHARVVGRQLGLSAADVTQLVGLLSKGVIGNDHGHDYHNHHDSHHHHHHHHSHGHNHHRHSHDSHTHSQQLSVAQLLQSIGASSAAQLTDGQAASAITRLLACATDPHCSLVTDAHDHVGEQQAEQAGSEGVMPVTGMARMFGWLRPAPGGRVPGAAKLASALLLFAETVVGMLLPPLISKMEGHAWWLSLLNCFAGGIFLTAGLMHLVPHCEEAQMSVDVSGWGLPGHYPLYLLLITLGYLLVFSVERVIMEGHDHGHGHSHHHHHHHHGQEGDCCEGTLLLAAESLTSKETGVRQRKPLSPPASSTSPTPEASHQHGHDLGHTSHSRGAMPNENTHFSVARGLPLLVGMSVHTALECLALGLITRHTAFLILLTAIAAHKGVSALALSAKFTSSGASLRQVVMLVGPFTLIAPASIAVGHWAGNVLPPGLQLLLNCLAAGTFLYVGASEILAEEFESTPHNAPWGLSGAAARGVKFLCVLLAVGCIALLGLMPHVH